MHFTSLHHIISEVVKNQKTWMMSLLRFIVRRVWKNERLNIYEPCGYKKDRQSLSYLTILWQAITKGNWWTLIGCKNGQPVIASAAIAICQYNIALQYLVFTFSFSHKNYFSGRRYIKVQLTPHSSRYFLHLESLLQFFFRIFYRCLSVNQLQINLMIRLKYETWWITICIHKNNGNNI